MHDCIFDIISSLYTCDENNCDASKAKYKSTLTKFGSFVCVDDGGFGRHVGHRTPGGQCPLAGVKLLREELLKLHADLYQIRSGGSGDDHLEYVPLQVSVHKDLTGEHITDHQFYVDVSSLGGSFGSAYLFSDRLASVVQRFTFHSS